MGRKLAKKVFGLNVQKNMFRVNAPKKCVQGEHGQKMCQRLRMFRVRTYFWGVELPTSDINQPLRNDMGKGEQS